MIHIETLFVDFMVDLSNSPYTTNRILEIPQDIKLELNNGTLTLKAGSKVYVPNGFESDGVTPKFDVFTIENAVTTVLGTTGTYSRIMCYNPTTQEMSLRYYHYTNVTTPDTGAYFNYNTSTNKIEYYASNIKDSYDYSLPIAYVHSTNGVIDTIEQIFNGFGYIGSTVFSLPGVKVQFPDGRNEDGTCINGYYTNDSVKTFSNISGTWCGEVWLGTTGLGISNSLKYIPEENRIKHTDGSYRNMCSLGYVFISSGKITRFTPCSVDSVVNSNMSNVSNAGRSYLSGLGMPSGRYIDLTLGASGSTYIAPANGYVYLVKMSGGFEYVSINTNELKSSQAIGNAGWTLTVFLPVVKGKVFTVTYNASGATNAFAFVYAEGEN